MKIKKAVALSLAWGVALALWLWEMATLAADKSIWMDLSNVVQHMVNVKLIGSDWNVQNASVLKMAGKNLVWIETNNFILSKDESHLQGSERVNKISWWTSSNILWWVTNEINGWTASTILWWESNINKGSYSTILWWKDNKIGETSQSNYSTIVWWTSNSLDWNGSIIVGWTDNTIENWDYSVVLWTDSHVINWNNSVALWKKSTNNASNSFLWTDGNDRPALDEANVFAVRWEHWMVVNANKAHPLAQLTIGGPLVIHKWDENVECTNSWVVKVVDWETMDLGGNYKCFCGCDGNGYWHSLYGQWRCEWMCNSDEKQPWCGTEVTIGNKDGKKVFLWTCNENSKPVVWSWAYVVDKVGKVYWTCQTDAWLTAACSGSVL